MDARTDLKAHLCVFENPLQNRKNDVGSTVSNTGTITLRQFQIRGVTNKSL